MPFERRWLLTVVAFVALGVALEAAVGAAIARQSGVYNAKTWLSSSRRGSVTGLLDRMYGELERAGQAVARGEDLAAESAGPNLEALFQRRLPPGLRRAWLIADRGAGVVKSGISACDGASALLGRLDGARRLVWCGDAPVLLVRISPADPRRAVYLGTVLDEAFLEEVKAMSLSEVELVGPRGVVATTLKLLSGAPAKHGGYAPDLDFGKFELELDGPYAGYFPDKVQDAYWSQVANIGRRRFDVFALASVLEPSLGPGDLRIVMFAPSDVMLLGPAISGAAMIALGLLVTVMLAALARRLIRAVSRPLIDLAHAAQAAATGDGAFQVPQAAGTFELASLSSSFIALLSRVEETQRRAAQSEKMAALGTLAGGVAHEINNPLGVILGFAQGLERRVPDGDALRMPVTSIVREALRCKALVQELLAFSRVTKKTDEPIDVAAAVRSSLLLLGVRAKTQGVEIVSELDDPLPRLRGSSTQLQQVVVNLGTNALDVMKRGGTLTVRARASDGDIVLEIADTGGGIPADIRGRIFEPFFTTKPAGEGTGLGLSLVYQICTQHHGRVDVASTGPNGTLMRVTLPVPPLHEARVAA